MHMRAKPNGSRDYIRNTNGCRPSGNCPGRAETSTGSSSCGRRVGLLLILLCMLLAMAACDGFYDIMIENPTEQAVVVRVTSSRGEDVYRARPCSIQIRDGSTVRPGELLQVAVENSDGRLISDTRSRSKDMGKGVPRLSVSIPTDQPGACPEPVAGVYLLIVKNYFTKDATIRLDDVDLGVVRAGSEQTFGPLPGEWQTAQGIAALDSQGDRLRRFLEADYDLGQVPRFMLDIPAQ